MGRNGRKIPVCVVEVVKPSQHKKYYRLRWICPKTGRPREESAKTTVRSQAERLAQQKATALSAGLDLDERLSWASFQARYESEYLVTLSDNTARAFRSSAAQLVRLCRPGQLSEVTADLLSQFAARRRAEGTAPATIGKDLRMLRAALGWAVEIGLLWHRPKIRPPKREAGKQSLMRGRPITEAEYQVIYNIVPTVRPYDAPIWQEFLAALWLSGLRLEEACILHWEQDAGFAVDFSGEHPCYRIFAEYHKGNRDELSPLTPDFATWLQQLTPANRRSGRVLALGDQFTPSHIGHILRDLGEAAGVVVDRRKPAYATAQSFRRSFGTRWARRVRPATLQRLMRHRHISTTMSYYVSLDADDLASELAPWR